MKHKILFYTLLFYVSFSFAQERFESKTFGFSIDIPQGWKLNEYEADVPGNVKLSETEKQNLFKEGYHVYLGYLYKGSFTGLNPKIQFNIALKHEENFDDFKKAVIASAKRINYLDNLKFTVQPTEITVAGIKSMYFAMTYTVEGSNKTIRSISYAIPFKNYMYQINFLDIPSDNDLLTLYSELIKTVKIK
ncbi:hypothetical protein [Flavobacterium beibuense]|uniref:hypothetical protein n=1 Tax=Flavobacterium beibuense TaxID=657326 RepID=UPI003A959480